MTPGDHPGGGRTAQCKRREDTARSRHLLFPSTSDERHIHRSAVYHLRDSCHKASFTLDFRASEAFAASSSMKRFLCCLVTIQAEGESNLFSFRYLSSPSKHHQFCPVRVRWEPGTRAHCSVTVLASYFRCLLRSVEPTACRKTRALPVTLYAQFKPVQDGRNATTGEEDCTSLVSSLTFTEDEEARDQQKNCSGYFHCGVLKV